MRTFDIVLRAATCTSYNAHTIRSGEGVAIVDTVERELSEELLTRLQSVARYDENPVIVLNHLKPDHSRVSPEPMGRAPQTTLCISTRATSMLKALLKPKVAA